MKRVLAILLTAVLLVGFAACSKNKDKDKTTTKADSSSTAAQQYGETTTAKEKSAADKKTDIGYLYNGFWYQNDENKVLVLQFSPDGSVTVNTYRRNSLANGTEAPDSVTYGSYKDNGDGTLRVYPDNDQPDVFDIYKVTGSTLIYQNDDPEGSSSSTLQYFDALNSDNAASVLFGDN